MTRNDILESLLVSSHRLVRIAAQRTGSTIPSATWRTLAILEAEGPMRIGELAKASRVTQPGMTRLLAGMVEEELVLRIADTEDSRAWLIRVTAKGSRQLAEWRQTLAEQMQQDFQGLDAEEWALLARAAELLESRIGSRALAS
ncbi:MarR family winged helix-turn-helix transcriptional regulator [Homoserinibacter sp. YIM 151385]|uniref:MarR family winged helix-turn-helix transcriptional regulator n=1 Tax=Homoserinibacter sp. YIM 151385 TaxID=2985506 RepID=UPI0022EFDD03|nr:MarR family transcriptional regulator [Homoserinibacter sp. YIM 151385]WBU39061.1 MarR family transcriptional regulator [Homoserinibacter sp. YIM 151385]